VRQIQMRNLNCDPRLMEPFYGDEAGALMGMRMLLQYLETELPGVEIGSYSHIYKD